MIETRFKDTELGRIPEDWEVKSIGSLAGDCFYGVGAEACPYNGCVKYIRITDIDDKSRCYVPSPTTSPSFYQEKYVVQENDLLVARTGASVGKSYLYDKNDGVLVFAGFLMKINVVKANPKYVFYNTLTKAYWNWIASESARTGQPGLNLQQIRLYTIPLPPLVEQNRIATALSNIDALISEMGRLIEKKRAIKQGAMQQLLTGKKRLKGFSKPWVEKKLGEICEFQNGYTPSKAVNSFWESGTIPWFRMEDIRTNGRILSDAIQHITEEAVKGNLFPANSIIMSTTATIGEHALLIVDSLANQQFTNLVIRKSLTQAVDVMWFYHYCFILGEWCRKNINEGGLAAVNMEDFSKVTIAAPQINEQKVIASVLTSMDNEISALEAKKAKYEQIKQGMMQQLLTGKIRLVETAVKTSATTANVHFRRSVLAAEIAERLYEEPTFGHVKMEKMLFLTERLCHIDIGSHYHRDAAGPYDNRALRSIDSQLRKQKWFDVKRTEKGNRYVPMQNCGKHKTYFDKYYSTVLPTFEKIIDTFKTQNTERCEIVATLYSAWEDLLHSNKPFTDADIVNEVLNNWHESKKRISQDRWLSAIQWMRENGFAPKV